MTNAMQPRHLEERGDFRRRLLDGLAESIREKGFGATQISDIVGKARTSNRTFYECFPNKESCFEDLIEEWGDELVSTVRAAIDPDAPWDRQIDRTVDAYLAAFAADPALAVMVSRELVTLGQRGVEWQERDIDRYVEVLMDMTSGPEMRRAGIQPVGRDTAIMLIGGIAEILDRATNEGRSPSSVAPTVKAVIKRVVGPA
jgi:AcrR family transcriptional regulator